ncbi:OmpA family protein [Psychromonas sp. Urea-02u-13]|uniref:OmpA family protein n=1 Tax=Psychromonas sp. Urea-02u-13 TaxID=2058326 RepID=UPI000C34161C|nr:OmpA family protein [Psychromonas sp. Urea-02u-13]PKG40314.1 OmpA family protein [Psychromonas sp. Urea-02u-13]
MRYLYIILLSVFIAGCSSNAIEMANGPTEQKYDLNDQEGDGVINARDACFESATGALVDNQGCGSETVYMVRHELLVNFTTNSYVVGTNYLPEIEGLADFMKEYPDADVTIEGHTSIRGEKALNDTLSQNRAEAIKALLVGKFGIDEMRVTAIGYGFSRLFLEGYDEYIHARNRRIVAEISSEKHIPDQKWTIYSVDKQLEE